MIVFVLFSIWAFQNHLLWTSAILFGVAVNIKMSALLMLPGFLLVLDFKFGLVRTLLALGVIVGLQALIGLEFLLENPEAYLKMSYNFERAFLKVEQVNF